MSIIKVFKRGDVIDIFTDEGKDITKGKEGRMYSKCKHGKKWEELERIERYGGNACEECLTNANAICTSEAYRGEYSLRA